MSKPAARYKVVVIVEDDSDGHALRELVGKTHPTIELDWIPANGIGNIGRKIEKFIALARDRIAKGRGCVAVVVDRDGNDLIQDEPHCTIARACERHRVPLVACKEAIEAWFLADPGCCQWLGLSLSRTTHGLARPKDKIAAAFLRRTGRTYQKRRARLELARQASGPDGSRNESLAEALRLLGHCVK